MSGGDVAVTFARAQIGKPYKFGATGPGAFDCSGLVYKSWQAAGVSIGRTTAQQIFNGTEVTRANLAIGDLVFPEISHVAIYAGENRVIVAPHTGAFVREESLDALGGVWRARRVGDPGMGDSSGTPAITTGVLDPVISRIPVLGKLNTIAEKLLDPTFYRRIGLGALALFIIGLGIAFLNRHAIERQISKTASDAGKAAEIGAML